MDEDYDIVDERPMNVQIQTRDYGTLFKLSTNDKNMDRVPADICCVIDVSASMGSEAVINTADKSGESHGLSLLDVVKHALRTIIKSLRENDRLAIVTFSANASVIFNLSYMNATGCTNAEAELDKLQPDSVTNLWDGLFTGLELLKGSQDLRRNASIFLLTDGQPNIVPPRGHVEMLKKYRNDNGMPCIVNTYGFGYSVDSQLLDDLARETRGNYSFIPDSSMVGTVFINTLSNVLSTVATNTVLCIGNGNDGGESTFLNIDVGTITSQQKRCLLLTDKFSDQVLHVVLKYDDTRTGKSMSSTYQLVTKCNDNDSPEIAESTKYRYLYIYTVGQLISLMNSNRQEQAQQLLKDTINIFEKCDSKNQYVQDLTIELCDQVSKAISKNDWYQKWGMDYLLSLLGAHKNQLCNNFKDPAIQHYGGTLFKKIRDEIDTIFCSLPAPKPSIRHSGITSNSLRTMSSYNDVGNPCFSGDSMVHLANGSKRPVKDIIVGDMVLGPTGPSRVTYVIRTKCKNDTAYFAELGNGLKITAWHPVRIGNTFRFPCKLSDLYEYSDCKYVYSFALDQGHTMVINDIECITWGHSFKDPVAAHPFFGSDSVINVLQKLDHDHTGHIDLPYWTVHRNSETGLIDGLLR